LQGTNSIALSEFKHIFEKFSRQEAKAYASQTDASMRELLADEESKTEVKDLKADTGKVKKKDGKIMSKKQRKAKQ
jgi:hypothetical protein